MMGVEQATDLEKVQNSDYQGCPDKIMKESEKKKLYLLYSQSS